MKAAIYCRVSTEGQEQDGTSLQTQLEACLKYCQTKGYELTYQFTVDTTAMGYYLINTGDIEAPTATVYLDPAVQPAYEDYFEVSGNHHLQAFPGEQKPYIAEYN